MTKDKNENMPIEIWLGYEPEIKDYNAESFYVESTPIPDLGVTTEYIRKDHMQARLDEVIDLCKMINEIADKGTPNKYNDWLDQHSRMEILSRDALTKLKEMRGE